MDGNAQCAVQVWWWWWVSAGRPPEGGCISTIWGLIIQSTLAPEGFSQPACSLPVHVSTVKAARCRGCGAHWMNGVADDQSNLHAVNRGMPSLYMASLESRWFRLCYLLAAGSAAAARLGPARRSRLGRGITRYRMANASRACANGQGRGAQ